MRIGCVLLAAGSGSRFGGDKLQHAVEGVSMAERACLLHADIDYASRILVARPNDAFVASVAEKYGFALVVNERAPQGIGTSVAAGAAALLSLHLPLDGALFAVCDQPYLTRSTVSSLLRVFSDAPYAIVAPCFDGKRGNPALFPSALLDELVTLDGDVGGSAIIHLHKELLVTVPVDDAAELIDVDVRTEELRNLTC